VFIVSASGDQKPQFGANFDTFGRSCTDLLIPMRAKFGVLEQSQGVHLPPNVIWLCSLCRLPMGKNHNFWQLLTFMGAPVSTPFYRWMPHLVYYSDPRSTLTCQISYRSVYSVVL